ncbi:MAG: ribonuclease HI family protein [bacterium]|nr:ribonuclease HI family protein [bacterium]
MIASSPTGEPPGRGTAGGLRCVAYIDGSCFGNPGESGCGVVLKTEAGDPVEKAGVYLGHATNNVAEYQGLLLCLEMAGRHGAESLTVYSDSELLVRQVNGRYRVKKPHLAELLGQVRAALASGRFRFQIRHVPREQNNEADGLARQAIRSRSRIGS